MKRWGVLLGGGLGLGLLALAPAHAASAIPDGLKNLSPFSVRMLYSDKTWKWGTGGAYFAPDSKFFAVTGEGGTSSLAVGRWRVTTNGELCFDAVWISLENPPSKATTCFRHAGSSNQIYQAKEANGAWYLIKSGTPKPEDMINQIVSGNGLACQLSQAAASFKDQLVPEQYSQINQLKTKTASKCN